MKLKALILAGSIAALPLAALADDPQTQTEKTTTTTTTYTGAVQAYEAGHSITILNDKGEPVTYTINDSSMVPKTLEVGKTVTIQTTGMSSGSPVVKTVTVTTTKETKKKSY